MNGATVQPHLQLSSGQVPSVVLTVGDPRRAQQVAGMCDESKEIAYNREYRSFLCKHEGEEFLVVSHGVGSAGCAICFEELIALGAKVILRAGTSGTLQPDRIKQGDVVIINAAVREDGVTRLLVPEGYPAIADPETFNTLKQVADEAGTGIKYGVTLTSDLFYPHKVVPTTLEQWSRAGVEIVEMEVATLFVIARLRGVRAAALCAVDGCPLKWDAGDYDPEGEKLKKAKANMLTVAISACVRLSHQYKK